MAYEELTLSKQEKKLSMAFLHVAFISLLIGGLMGLLQTLVRSGKFTLPWGIGYYQILTVHGVILGLVLTTYFIIGFPYARRNKTVATPIKERKHAWFGCRGMLAGTIMTGTSSLRGQASVLYTF